MHDRKTDREKGRGSDLGWSGGVGWWFEIECEIECELEGELEGQAGARGQAYLRCQERCILPMLQRRAECGSECTV